MSKKNQYQPLGSHYSASPIDLRNRRKSKEPEVTDAAKEPIYSKTPSFENIDNAFEQKEIQPRESEYLQPIKMTGIGLEKVTVKLHEITKKYANNHSAQQGLPEEHQIKAFLQEYAAVAKLVRDIDSKAGKSAEARKGLYEEDNYLKVVARRETLSRNLENVAKQYGQAGKLTELGTILDNIGTIDAIGNKIIRDHININLNKLKNIAASKDPRDHYQTTLGSHNDPKYHYQTVAGSDNTKEIPRPQHVAKQSVSTNEDERKNYQSVEGSLKDPALNYQTYAGSLQQVKDDEAAKIRDMDKRMKDLAEKEERIAKKEAANAAAKAKPKAIHKEPSLDPIKNISDKSLGSGFFNVKDTFNKIKTFVTEKFTSFVNMIRSSEGKDQGKGR